MSHPRPPAGFEADPEIANVMARWKAEMDSDPSPPEPNVIDLAAEAHKHRRRGT